MDNNSNLKSNWNSIEAWQSTEKTVKNCMQLGLWKNVKKKKEKVEKMRGKQKQR